MSLFAQSRYSSNLATAPLAGMILALIGAVLPLTERIAGWVLAGFLAACVARLVFNRPGGRLPSLPFKLLFFVLGVGGVAVTYGTPLGLEPGFSILVALVALKLIEANGSRDMHVLALLGFFLALCDLFFSQELVRWLYVAAILLWLVGTLVLFHRGGGVASYPRSAWFAAKLLLQSLPICALLFLFFPRVYGGFRFQFGQSLLPTSGMSDRLSPGSVSAMAMNRDVAFRVDFPDGNAPPVSAMYWRGAVLWRGDGLTWVVGRFLYHERRSGLLGGSGIRQRISLEPHGGRWLFALDWPASDPRGARYQPGDVLQSLKAITTRFHYEIISRPDNREMTLLPDQRVAALRLPDHISPRVQALVDSWKAGGKATPEQIIEAASHYFRHEHFAYSLQPGTYGETLGLEEFLFERRQGFCEHYAAAFATLMRLAGIPSRVVIGYHGGEFNSLGKYVIVRQSDAHAWCEVWLRDAGWQRVDPTELIAPDRLSSTLDSFLESHAAQIDPAEAQRSITATGWRAMQHDLQLAWDGINYQWDLHILSFDQDAQNSFLFLLGLGSTSWLEIFFWILLAVALLIVALSCGLRRVPRKTDKVAAAYARFCRALARAGLAREPSEGAQHFGARAAQRFPEQASQIERISALYIELRYGPKQPGAQAFLAAVRSLPRLNATSGK